MAVVMVFVGVGWDASLGWYLKVRWNEVLVR